MRSSGESMRRSATADSQPDKESDHKFDRMLARAKVSLCIQGFIEEYAINSRHLITTISHCPQKACSGGMITDPSCPPGHCNANKVNTKIK